MITLAPRSENRLQSEQDGHLAAELLHPFGGDQDLASGVAAEERLGNLEEPAAGIFLKCFLGYSLCVQESILLISFG
jgi:hypothetical protein